MIFASIAAFGVSAGAGLAQVNVPFGRPVLVLSLLLMVLGLTVKGLTPGLLAVAGGMLVYVGMFELRPPMSEMTGMEASSPGGELAFAAFWSGVIVIVVAYALAYRPGLVRRE